MMHEWVYWQLIGHAINEKVGCGHRCEWLIQGLKTKSLKEKSSNMKF